MWDFKDAGGAGQPPQLGEAARCFAAGLIITGCMVIDIGLVATPVLYYTMLHCGIKGGAMITGSHNPPDENGFKLACGEGTLYREEILKLKEMAETGRFKSGKGRMESKGIEAPYLAMLQEKIKLGPRRLKVTVDCGNGTASLFAEMILRA